MRMENDVAVSPGVEQKQKKGTFDVLPNPVNYISYRQETNIDLTLRSKATIKLIM